MKKGDKVTLKIEKLVYEGAGLATTISANFPGSNVPNVFSLKISREFVFVAAMMASIGERPASSTSKGNSRPL